ncbi:MAG: glycosyltransferase [Pseudomonadota bacterium]
MSSSLSKRIVLATFGTHGDVLPFVGLAKQLQARGHRPVIATSSLYESLLREHGVEFAPAAPHHDQIMRDLSIDMPTLMKRIFNPWTGGNFVLQKMVLPYAEQIFSELDAACEGADLLISQPMATAAYLVAHKRALDWRTVILQPLPLGFMSVQDVPVISNHLPMHRLPGWIGQRGYKWLMDLSKMAGRRMVRVYDDKARELGCYDPKIHPLCEAVFAPKGTIALFPQSLMKQPLATDFPQGVSFAGFSYFDGGAKASLPEELVSFLAQGDPPVVFTLGSSIVFNPGQFCEESSLACQKLGVRAVFLVGQHQIKQPLPPSQIAVPWASHAALFPRCRAVVHQGGIGTCAQASRAGVPQLFVPHAHDQPDNAARLGRLGVALTLLPSKAHGAPLLKALTALVSDEALSAAARQFQGSINQICGTVVAADQL